MPAGLTYQPGLDLGARIDKELGLGFHGVMPLRIFFPLCQTDVRRPTIRGECHRYSLGSPA